jgi:hypothetical protein
MGAVNSINFRLSRLRDTTCDTDPVMTFSSCLRFSEERNKMVAALGPFHEQCLNPFSFLPIRIAGASPDRRVSIFTIPTNKRNEWTKEGSHVRRRKLGR